MPLAFGVPTHKVNCTVGLDTRFPNFLGIRDILTHQDLFQTNQMATVILQESMQLENK